MTQNGPTLQSEKELLLALVREFQKLNDKLDTIAENNERILRIQSELQQNITNKDHKNNDGALEPDAVALLTLPAALRKTAMVLYKLDGATADDLARETKRLRAVESASANQLVRMGYLKKKREGRKVIFYIEY